jgi:hypothetical protein
MLSDDEDVEDTAENGFICFFPFAAYAELCELLNAVQREGPLIAMALHEPRRTQFAQLLNRVLQFIDGLPIQMDEDDKGESDP